MTMALHAVGVRFVILPKPQIVLFNSGRRSLLLVPRGDEPGHAPPYRAGSRIPLVQAVGKKAIVTVVATRVTEVSLGDIDDQDARELGHADVDAWMDAWTRERQREDPGYLFNERARAWRIEVAVDRVEPERVLPAQSRRPHFGLRQLQASTTNLSDVLDAGSPPDEHAVAGYNRTAHAADHDRYEQLLAQRRQLPLVDRLALVLADADARSVRFPRRQMDYLERLIGGLEETVYRPPDRYADAETA